MEKLATDARYPSGFTLIELSIVLVIIGLVVGGILVGQEMIHNAQMRQVISDVERYKTAINTFKGKYSQLPGDLPYPEKYFDVSNWDASYRGNPTFGGGSVLGDGIVSWQGESSLAFPELSLAGLVQGMQKVPGSYPAASLAICGTNQPKGPLGQGCYQLVANIYNATGTLGINWITYGSQRTDGTWLFYTSNAAVTPTEAASIDQKMDDGRPAFGGVVTMVMQNGSGTPNSTTYATQYGVPWTSLCGALGGNPYPTASVSYPGNAAWADTRMCFMGFKIDQQQ